MSIASISSIMTQIENIRTTYTPVLLAELRQYGIKMSGDSEYDLQRLNLEKQLRQTGGMLNATNNEKTQSSATLSKDVPWADIMNALGLTVTGDYQEDYDTTIRELNYRISSASSDEEKQKYQEIKDGIRDTFTQETGKTNQYLGASIQANLNRAFFGI